MDPMGCGEPPVHDVTSQAQTFAIESGIRVVSMSCMVSILEFCFGVHVFFLKRYLLVKYRQPGRPNKSQVLYRSGTSTYGHVIVPASS